MFDCPTIEQLERYVAALPTSRDVAEHVALCQACGEHVDGIRADNLLIGEFIAANAGEIPPQADEPVMADSVPGYRILAIIRRGGQGVVYKAHQISTKRSVALKLLIGGAFATPRQRGRFEREVELVAGLRHPNIVTVFDSGATPDGRLYYAMEYVDGVPLDEYAGNARRSKSQNVKTMAGEDARTTHELLALFAMICEAVSAAHLRGIVHRDLKPGNILVDTDGAPHILDFGLAKLSGAEALAESHGVSMTGEFMGTFAYAAPEQTLGRPDVIDVRTDVHALGVILFELLTGQHPYRLTGSISDMIRTITEVAPPAPSTLRRGLDDELDTIVLKALAKEPERRYQSAGELLRDVRRYQSGEAIDAKRDSAWYVLRKTVFRHRQRVALGVALILLLLMCVVAIGGYIVFSAKVSAEKLRSIAEAERSEATSLVLRSAARPRNPEKALQFRAHDLDRLNDSIQWGWLGSNPNRESHVAALLSAIYRKGDSYWEAENLIRQANMRRGAVGVADPANVASGLYDLADVLLTRHRTVEADQHCVEALNMNQEMGEGGILDAARDMELLARIRINRGDLPAAAKLASEAASIQAARLGSENDLLARSLDTYAAALLGVGDLGAAESQCVRALQLRMTLLQDDDPAVAESLRRLASIVDRRPTQTQDASLAKALGMPGTQPIGDGLRGLASGLERLASPENINGSEALVILEHVLLFKETTLGRDHKALLSTLAAMETEAHDKRDFVAEKNALTRAVQVVEHNSGPRSLAMANCLYDLAVNLEALEQYSEAIATMKRSLEIWWAFPPDSRDDFGAAVRERYMAVWMAFGGQYEEAAGYFAHCGEVIGRLYGPQQHIVPFARAARAWCLVHLGRMDGIEHEARDALAQTNRLGPAMPDGQRSFVTFFVGSLLARVGKVEEGERLMTLAWEGDADNGAIRERIGNDRARRVLIEEMIRACELRHDQAGEARWRKELATSGQ